jgi:hypothetical protein
MKVYEGTLALKKLTRKMVVYSNLELVAQYIPKKMFAARGLKKHPAKLVFTLTVPGTAKRERRRVGGAKRKVKASQLMTGDNVVNNKNPQGRMRRKPVA